MSDAPIQPGTQLEDGTTVGDYIGRSEAALNFYGEHPEFGRVVVKVLAPQLDEALAAHDDAIGCMFGVRHHNLQSVVARGQYGPRHYLVYEYVHGQSLRATLEQVADADGGVDVDMALQLVGQVSQGLEVLHTVDAHGVLTSDNIFLRRDGRIVVVNVGYARLAMQASRDANAYGSSPYIAPEVRDDPWNASEVSDIYSLGVLLVALLSGREPTMETLPALIAAVCERHPEVADAVQGCVAEEQMMRIQSVGEVRALLRQRADLASSSALAAQSVPADSEMGDVLDRIEMPSVPKLRPAITADTDAERWIASIDGRDRGPFTAAKIREMLQSDEITENTRVVDMFTQQGALLIDVPEFTDFVIDFLPQRAKLRIERAERRDEVVKQAKRTGATTIVAAVLAVVAGAAALIAMQVDSPPVPFGDIVRPFAHTFVLDEPTYVEIAADDALIASLFDFSDPVPEPEENSGRSSRRSRSGGGEEDDGAEPSLDDYVVSFDGSRPSRKLSNDEINQTVAANQSSIQRCFQGELRANPRFAGVTVNWSIVPDGRTTSIRIEPHGPVTDDATSCLRRAFRRMRFPEFNDVPMNITIPFRLQ